MKVALVTAQFNEKITSKLRQGAIDLFQQRGLDFESYEVPGVMELSLASQWLLEKESISGVLALGVVIKGQTDHYEYICSSASKAHLDVQLKFSKPLSFGILTVQDAAQAYQRAGGTKGNKGFECAQALYDMIQLRNKIN